MTELSPITAKSMVRLFVSGNGRCVLSILFIGFFLSIISDDAIARDTKNFTFPKGIVLNAGQYPSSVYKGDTYYWFPYMFIIGRRGRADRGIVRSIYKY